MADIEKALPESYSPAPQAFGNESRAVEVEELELLLMKENDDDDLATESGEQINRSIFFKESSLREWVKPKRSWGLSNWVVYVIGVIGLGWVIWVVVNGFAGQIVSTLKVLDESWIENWRLGVFDDNTSKEKYLLGVGKADITG